MGTIPDNIVAPIRIALISDGVDPGSETLRGKIYGIEPGANVISAKFGTTAARLIAQICPKSSLYIAKAEIRKSTSHNGRHMSLLLAAEVNQNLSTIRQVKLTIQRQ
jgi:Na+/melibiose symporter-like transporter